MVRRPMKMLIKIQRMTLMKTISRKLIKINNQNKNSRNFRHSQILRTYDDSKRKQVLRSLAGQRSQDVLTQVPGKTILDSIKAKGNRRFKGLRNVKSRSSIQSLKRDSRYKIPSSSATVVVCPQSKIAKMNKYLKKCEILRHKMKKSSDDNQKSKLLVQENKIMRRGLKEMNGFLSDLIDHLKEKKLASLNSLDYKYGNNGKLKKTREEKIRKLTAESQNYQNMIANLSEEHRKYKERIFQISDPSFILTLQKEVAESSEQIDKLNKHLRFLKDDQFKREKKMGEVISHGVTDAMGTIQDNVKQMTVLSVKKKKYDAQIQFQAENESQIDQHTEDMKKKVSDLEAKVRSLGLDPDAEETDTFSEHLKDPLFIKIKKQKLARYSRKVMSKKFFSKFHAQKEKLEDILSQYDDSFEKDSKFTISGTDFGDEKYLLLSKLSKVCGELKHSLPTITSKLPWTTSISFKPRSSSGSMGYPYGQQTVKRFRKINSRSVNDIHENASSSEIRKLQGSHSSLFSKSTSKPKVLLDTYKTPYMHNAG
ncbi:unnamed protein product [Moneuplotes crassus]|uniref:Uncharacterized protein n=1 Tax=Euplotes crassus TaxID=5936 RepID=A0AAD1UAA0_EUPCR|nr:unnamed protein product [Moneuplotes crassus]